MLVDHKDEEDPVVREMIPTGGDVTDHTSSGEMLYLVAELLLALNARPVAQDIYFLLRPNL